MRVFGKFVAGFFFIILFFSFLILATIRFEIFNKQFLFFSFQRNNIYQELPSGVSKLTIEDNLSQVFRFLDGQQKDFQIKVPLSATAISGNSILWSSNTLPDNTQKNLALVQEINTKLLIAVCILFILLLLLFIIAEKFVLLTVGIITLLLGIAGRVFFFVISQNTPPNELSQIVLVLLSKSILADIMWSWILFGVVLMIIWFIVHIYSSQYE